MRRALLAAGAAAVMSLGLMAQATLISDLRSSLPAQDTSPTPSGAMEGNIWTKAREWRRIGAESLFFARTVFSGTLTFTGLYATTGSTASTRLVSNLRVSKASDLVSTGSHVFFLARGNGGLELRVSDGTEAGTMSLSCSGTPDGCLAPLGTSGSIIFRGDDATQGYALYVSDGTSAGTRFVLDIDSSSKGTSEHILYAVPFDRDKALFIANDGTHGSELWITDGTSAGTRMLKDIDLGASSGLSSSSALFPVGGKVFFTASESTHGQELWITDGTAAGTQLVKDIVPGSANGKIELRHAASLGGKLYFGASDGTAMGKALWTSDGTAAGTRLVADMVPGSNSSGPRLFTPVGNGSTCAFTAFTPATGVELFIGDGTAAGTTLLEDIQPGSAHGDPEHLVVWQGLLWFRANDGVHGDELWVSDGSSAGTRLFADIWPGATSSSVGYFTPCGSRHLYFRADDGTGKGIELWRSDGTVAGTQLATEIRPGPAGANPYLDYSEGSQSRFLVLWGDVIFGADDGVHARELWKFRNGATAQPIGDGFAPQHRAIPTLRSEDPLIGATVNIEGSISSGPNTVAITLFGIPDYSPMRLLPSEDAWSYLDLGLPFWVWNVSAANAQKRFAFQVGIPNDPHLMGLRTVLQTWVLGTDGPRGFDLSNGVS